MNDVLREQRSTEERVIAEQVDRRSDAQIIADEQAKKREQLADFERRIAPNLDCCDACKKSRSTDLLPPRYRGRFDAGIVSPINHCACAGGPVRRADEWSVLFLRDTRDGFARPMLKPVSGAFSPLFLYARRAPSDVDFHPTNWGFEWAEVSPDSRRLAFTILALVAGDDRADRYADAFMREWLAVNVAKTSERTQSITLGEVREWLTSREAAAGAAA